jgi:hypothetical protein
MDLNIGVVCPFLAGVSLLTATTPTIVYLFFWLVMREKIYLCRMSNGLRSRALLRREAFPMRMSGLIANLGPVQAIDGICH